jgi:SRSO17 transposase
MGRRGHWLLTSVPFAYALPMAQKRPNRVHLPGDELWLVAERRSATEAKYHLTNHAASASLKTIANAIKARWSCEQAHQQLKEELGLDHFEGAPGEASTITC